MPKRHNSSHRRINELNYRLTAFLFLIRLPLALAALGLGLASLALTIPNGLVISLTLLGLAVLTSVSYIINSGSVICRLCRVQFMRKLGCKPRRGSHAMLGSVRLPLAFKIFFKKRSISCPYCGEKSIYFPKKGETSKRNERA